MSDSTDEAAYYIKARLVGSLMVPTDKYTCIVDNKRIHFVVSLTHDNIDTLN